MAGRGTDIRLGGRGGSDTDGDQVAGLGGLYVIGTGRHASSRLDDQLRGRSGRQGDPGGSVFFVSLEDELITAYAPDSPEPRDVAARRPGPRPPGRRGGGSRAARRRGRQPADPPEHVRATTSSSRSSAGSCSSTATGCCAPTRPTVALASRCPERYAELTAALDPDVASRAARQIVLYHLDRGWADHLATLAGVREGIHLRALGHGPNPFVMALDPLAEFHAEAVKLFAQLLEQVEERSAETFRTAADHQRRGRPRRRRAEAAQRHLDVHRAGQPVRHRPRPRAAPPQPGPPPLILEPAPRRLPSVQVVTTREKP